MLGHENIKKILTRFAKVQTFKFIRLPSSCDVEAIFAHSSLEAICSKIKYENQIFYRVIK
jgi:hypothetical protein